MAKLEAPLFSLKASGRIGNGPVYSSCNGRAYAKDYAVPSDPNTDAQWRRRMIFSFLTKSFPLLSDAYRSSWFSLASRTRVSPANAFMSYNLNRWSHNLPPVAFLPVSSAPFIASPEYFQWIAGSNFVDCISFGLGSSRLWGHIFSFPSDYPFSLDTSSVFFIDVVNSGSGCVGRIPRLPSSFDYGCAYQFSFDGIVSAPYGVV